MVDWGGKLAAWFAGVAGVGAALATLIATTAKPSLHGVMRALFVAVVLIAVGSFIGLLLTGLRAIWTAWHNRRTAPLSRPPGSARSNSA